MKLGAFMDPEYPIFSTTLCYLERDDAYLMLHRVKKENDCNRDKWIGIGGKFEVGGFKLPFIGDKVFKGLQTNYYKGSFVGAGISIGYQFYVSPHWNLELSAGAGLARLSYHAEPVSGPKRSSYVDSKRFLPIPTEIGVTFVYLFNSKK